MRILGQDRGQLQLVFFICCSADNLRFEVKVIVATQKILINVTSLIHIVTM